MKSSVTALPRKVLANWAQAQCVSGCTSDGDASHSLRLRVVLSAAVFHTCSWRGEMTSLSVI